MSSVEVLVRNATANEYARAVGIRERLVAVVFLLETMIDGLYLIESLVIVFRIVAWLLQRNRSVVHSRWPGNRLQPVSRVNRPASVTFTTEARLPP
jgi:hypothetical protein